LLLEIGNLVGHQMDGNLVGSTEVEMGWDQIDGVENSWEHGVGNQAVVGCLGFEDLSFGFLNSSDL